MNGALRAGFLAFIMAKGDCILTEKSVCLCNTAYDTYLQVLEYRVRLFHPIYDTQVSTTECYYFKAQLSRQQLPTRRAGSSALLPRALRVESSLRGGHAYNSALPSQCLRACLRVESGFILLR